MAKYVSIIYYSDLMQTKQHNTVKDYNVLLIFVVTVYKNENIVFAFAEILSIQAFLHVIAWYRQR